MADNDFTLHSICLVFCQKELTIREKYASQKLLYVYCTIRNVLYTDYLPVWIFCHMRCASSGLNVLQLEKFRMTEWGKKWGEEDICSGRSHAAWWVNATRQFHSHEAGAASESQKRQTKSIHCKYLSQICASAVQAEQAHRTLKLGNCECILYFFLNDLQK